MQNDPDGTADTAVRRLVRHEQLSAHFSQLPAVAIAPAAGAAFVTWVLWGAVENHYLLAGLAAVTAVSAIRLVAWRRYFAVSRTPQDDPPWRRFAVGAAFFSGCVWGSAAPLLYPPQLVGYEVFLLVLLTLVPIVPVAAMAVYLPAFYAYYLTCLAPFVLTLALQPSRAEKLSALLLVMMLGAILTFARRYSRSLEDSIRLRIELAARSDALSEAIRQKTHFIAAASHDLRDPVHAMGLLLSGRRLEDGHDGDAHLLHQLAASQRSLRSLLNNLLDVSSLDANKLEPRVSDFHIADLMVQLHHEYALLASDRGLDFRCRYVDDIARADVALVERMLRNLLANALKYTASGGIALLARRGPGVLKLQVIDTGVGIRPEHLGTIFDEFMQLRECDQSRTQGLGLGLSIVRRLARLCGHAVHVRSVHGRGTTFTIAVARGTPAALVTSTPLAGTELAPAAMESRAVMVIDDDQALLDTTSALLRHWGLRTEVFRSGEQALARLDAGGQPPHLVIVDQRLGHTRSGLDVAAMLRRRSGTSLQVIVITADTAPKWLRDAFDSGYFLLHKPVEPSRLHACIVEALAST